MSDKSPADHAIAAIDTSKQRSIHRGSRGTIAPMPNIASVLKEEISRIARKEIRAETESLKKAVASYRSEIAALKRRMQTLEQELRRVGKGTSKKAVATPTDSPPQSLRFAAKGFASTRARLGLSAEDYGLLVGAAGKSVYRWETGEVQPRAKHLSAIAALRTMGKKEAAARLDALRAAG